MFNGDSETRSRDYTNENVMGFQSFGSKNSSLIKKGSKFNLSRPVTRKHQTEESNERLGHVDIGDMMHDSVQEFIEETKSIEDDLK